MEGMTYSTGKDIQWLFTKGYRRSFQYPRNKPTSLDINNGDILTALETPDNFQAIIIRTAKQGLINITTVDKTNHGKLFHIDSFRVCV